MAPGKLAEGIVLDRLGHPAHLNNLCCQMLGDKPRSLTDTAETMLDTGTYYQRSTDSVRLPGALINNMTLTL